MLTAAYSKIKTKKDENYSNIIIIIITQILEIIKFTHVMTRLSSHHPSNS